MKYIYKLMKSQVIGLLSFLLLWEILHRILHNHSIPSPISTILYTIKFPGKLLLHSAASCLRVFFAISISIILGVPTGIILGMNSMCKRIFSPLLYFLYPIPKVAFLPIFMLLFGLGNTSKIILIIWIIIFQIILSVRDGVEQISPLQWKVMDSFCTTTVQKYRYLILPAILSQIFSGLRISIGISLASLFFAENYATTYGIGYFILSAWTKMNYVEMFSGILIIGFVGILLFKLIDQLEILCTPWINRRK
jgi:ABC-type nitrate/sulfonate/bicarbonate transport system permease component